MNYFQLQNIGSEFEKKFSFKQEETWVLPPKSLVHRDDIWHLKSLLCLKKELNHVKSLLNDKGEEWHKHTTCINPSALVIETIRKNIQPQILTQAWCKFYEILSNYKLVRCSSESLKSFHLCEAPGAFISALNFYLRQECPHMTWEWLANTLNPYYEGHSVKDVIVDDRLVFPTLRNWFFGKDGTGDIMNPQFLKDLRTFLQQKTFDLITADGSVNCLENPAEQELKVSELQFTEMIIALYSLAPGASFVLKKFTFFECISICTMYLLNCIFKEVHVFKPFTSKPGNSEVYVICLEYQGAENLNDYLDLLSETYASKSSKALFPRSAIPDSFISQLMGCSELFMKFQQKSIYENIALYSTPLPKYELEIKQIQKLCAEKYIEKCNINPFYGEFRMFPPKKQILTSFHGRQKNCKILFFQAVGETFDKLSQSKEMSWSEIVQDVDRRIAMCFPSSTKQKRDETLEWYFVGKEFVNRMKSKNYENWLVVGKKMGLTRNSKFCHPMILHLWNRISHEDKVQVDDHKLKEMCVPWNISALLELLREETRMEDSCLIYMPTQRGIEQLQNDGTLVHMKNAVKSSIEFNFLKPEIKESDVPHNSRILYINATSWINSLHQENIVKYDLAGVLSSVVKFMMEGDTLILCLQSLLTRYTIGLLFMLLSLFEKFVCLLPDHKIPAACGQLWVLHNFKNPGYTTRTSHYMERLAQYNTFQIEVLETVPIASLCGGYFYEFLLFMNNEHMLRRLRSLISTEKLKLQSKEM